jgi:hypothetical protein
MGLKKGKMGLEIDRYNISGNYNPAGGSGKIAE